MQTGNSVIIHRSPIVRQGLKSILLSRGIGISDVMPVPPDGAVLAGWKELLVLTDVQYADAFKKHARILGKNGNTIVGIANAGSSVGQDKVFSSILGIDSNTGAISLVLDEYMSRISEVRSDNQLSARETEILTMVAQGFSNKQIAGKLFISIHTVISHRKNITFKLGVKSISGLTLYAALNNLVDFQR